MFLKNLFEQTLLELDWYDRSPLARELERYRGKYVHFTRGVPGRRPADAHVVKPPQRPSYWSRDTTRAYNRGVARAERMNATAALPVMKVNPRSFHADPRGIYFYPVDYLLSRSEKLRSGQQFATDFRFYFIVDIKEDRRGVNLQFASWADVEEIALRNGWKDDLDAFRAMPPDGKARLLPRYANPDMPGSVLWHLAERLIKDGKTTWAKAFSGLTYIRDPNLAIIHENEPNQIVVFDPSIITTVKSGETGAVERSAADKPEYWQHAIVTVMKAVRGELGGELVWQKKRPSLSFTLGKVSATLRMGDGSYGVGVSLTLDYTYGRAVDSLTLSGRDFETKGVAEIVSQITDRVRSVAARKSDLTFKPVISEADAQRLLMAKVGVPGTFEWTTEINNDSGVEYRRMHVTGSSTRLVDGVTLRERLGADVNARSVSFRAGQRVQDAKHEMFGAYNYGSSRDAPPTIQQNLDSLFEEVREHMVRSWMHLEPRERSASGYTSHRERRFSDADDFSAYKGWLALNSGLSFEGRLAEAFPEEVAAYHAYGDKRHLHGEIAYMLDQFNDRSY